MHLADRLEEGEHKRMREYKRVETMAVCAEALPAAPDEETEAEDETIRQRRGFRQMFATDDH